MLKCISSHLAQTWLKCDSDLFQSRLCIIMLKCILSRFTLQTSCSDLTQMWLRSILVSSVLHHIKMHSHQFSFRFSLHLQFFLVSSCFFLSSCRSSVLKKEATVMMSSHQPSHHHLNLVSAILFRSFQSCVQTSAILSQ